MLEKELDFCLQRFLLINAYADGILDQTDAEAILDKASATKEQVFHAGNRKIGDSEIVRVGDRSTNPHSRKNGVQDRKNRKYCLSSKMYCTSCGSHYGPRPIHSTSYNDLVWACNGRFDRSIHCHEKYIYELILASMLHEAMRNLAVRRQVSRDIIRASEGILHGAESNDLSTYFTKLQKIDPRQMACDFDDILLAINEIAMDDEKGMCISWIDGEISNYLIPKYSQKRGVHHE